MRFDLEYRKQLKVVILNSIQTQKISLKDKQGILRALPQIWKDLEESKLLKEGMTFQGFCDQAQHAYEESNFEELFASLLGGKKRK